MIMNLPRFTFQVVTPTQTVTKTVTSNSFLLALAMVRRDFPEPNTNIQLVSII